MATPSCWSSDLRGGGGIAFFQLTRSSAQVLLYTALGNDEAAEQVSARLLRTGAEIHAARREALINSGVRAEVVVGSAFDPREACALADFPSAQRPAALVMTEGAAGGRVETAGGVQLFAAPEAVARGGGAYGAGDSFAGALTYFLAAGLDALEASARAGRYGAAVLARLDPLEAQLGL